MNINIWLEDTNGDRTHGSTKSYRVLYNSLNDFQTEISEPLFVDGWSKKHLEQFIQFLRQDHRNKKEYFTKGKLSNNTIMKRIKIMCTFWGWMIRKGYAELNTDLLDFRVRTMSLNITAQSWAGVDGRR